MTSLSELIHSFKSLHRMKVISFRTNECVYKQLDNICIEYGIKMSELMHYILLVVFFDNELSDKIQEKVKMIIKCTNLPIPILEEHEKNYCVQLLKNIVEICKIFDQK